MKICPRPAVLAAVSLHIVTSAVLQSTAQCNYEEKILSVTPFLLCGETMDANL